MYAHLRFHSSVALDCSYHFQQLKMHVGNCKSVCDILVRKDKAVKT